MVQKREKTKEHEKKKINPLNQGTKREEKGTSKEEKESPTFAGNISWAGCMARYPAC